MVEFLTVVYLFYSFVAMYFIIFFVLIYLRHKNDLFFYKKAKKKYSLSIVVPCYNEEKTIGKTIESLLKIKYKQLRKIIIVDDCSTDNSFNIIKKYSKKYKKIIAIRTPKNTGKASGAKNYGSKFVNTELIGFVDADSYPLPDSIEKMIGFFDDRRVGGVTASILVKNTNNLIERLQDLEYRVIVFTRKLLGFVDAIYVTPGPLAIYRKSVFDKVGRFDENNLTEDIEITWNILSKGYKIEMSTLSKSYTVVPDNFKDWYKQRIRWNMGGLQTINKHKKYFLRRGILGLFVIPFFVLSWIIGIVGIIILFYRISRELIIKYFLTTKYSIEAQVAVLSLRDISLTPNVLVFFGTAILILSTSFTLFALSKIKDKKIDIKKNSITFLLFAFVYLLAYPLILFSSIYKTIKSKKTW
ncbi:MAG: hypothetical protein KatS3mg001_167 [Candidatus Pacearchaeota archaeon]|nr:MAG: hypothetical protein KatS3mg001_167 [Candidatus Pacearchaeota archaeon]